MLIKCMDRSSPENDVMDNDLLDIGPCHTAGARDESYPVWHDNFCSPRLIVLRHRIRSKYIDNATWIDVGDGGFQIIIINLRE